MNNDFLQKVNLELLKKETGKTLDEIAELVGISAGRNLNKWKQGKAEGGSRPTYNAIYKLLQAGASLESIFGIKNANEFKQKEQTKISDREVLEALKRAISDL